MGYLPIHMEPDRPSTSQQNGRGGCPQIGFATSPNKRRDVARAHSGAGRWLSFGHEPSQGPKPVLRQPHVGRLGPATPGEHPPSFGSNQTDVSPYQRVQSRLERPEPAVVDASPQWNPSRHFSIERLTSKGTQHVEPNTWNTQGPRQVEFQDTMIALFALVDLLSHDPSQIFRNLEFGWGQEPSVRVPYETFR